MYYIFIYRQVGIMTVTINTYYEYYKRATSFVHIVVDVRVAARIGPRILNTECLPAFLL